MSQTEAKGHHESLGPIPVSLRGVADVLMSPRGDRWPHRSSRETRDTLGTQSHPRMSPAKEEMKPLEGQETVYSDMSVPKGHPGTRGGHGRWHREQNRAEGHKSAPMSPQATPGTRTGLRDTNQL